jgi:hypothetical protein
MLVFALLLLSSFHIVLATSDNAECASPTMLSPFQVMKPTPDHLNLTIVEEGLKKLTDIQEKVTIVGVVGPYHSG